MSCEIILGRSFLPGLEAWLDPPQAPMTIADFEILISGAPIYKRLDTGEVWFRHPNGMPWFSASFKEGALPGTGYISFSLSYGHIQFIKVWLDAIELSLRLAKQINARVFDEFSGQEINQENADCLLAPGGALVEEQKRVWLETAAKLEEHLLAPLEYPIGKNDAVADFFVFALELNSSVSTSFLAQSLCLLIEPGSFSEQGFAVQDKERKGIVSRVLRRQGGGFEIRPFYFMEPFAKVASATFGLALAIQKELGGSLYFNEKPLDKETGEQIQKESGALAVEFFLWWNKKLNTAS